MECPVCHHNLRRVRSRRVEIDICPRCKGKWFDEGEFTDFVKELSQKEGIAPRRDRLFEARQVTRESQIQEEGRRCPRCGVEMKKFNYAYDSNVFLDKCPECKGIWSDAGESTRVASYMKDDPKVRAVAEGILKHQKERESYQDLSGLNQLPLYWMFLPRIILPLADDAPRKKFPYITIAIIAICTGIFLGQLYFGDKKGGYLKDWGFVPAHFFSMGMVTAIFLHGGWLHLGGNMFFLWLFGDNIEDRLSRVYFLGFYLAAGIAANAAHGVFNLDSDIPCVGASGAISGIMGAYLAFFPKARIKTLFFYRILYVPAYVFLGLWFMLQLFNLALSSMVGGSSIAWYAHIGGFLFGVVFAVGFKRMVLRKDNRAAEHGLMKEE